MPPRQLDTVSWPRGAGRHLVAVATLCAALLGLAGCQVAPVGGTGRDEVRPTASRIEAAVTPDTPGRVGAPTPPRRIALALGGGAARGFAHIGVIQVLEAQGIRPDIVVGTSAGSLVAALYADGKSGAELEALALTLDESALTDWSLPSRGVLRGDALARWVRQATGGRAIEQLARPLGIVATDLQTGTGVLFQRGDTGQAVRASSAVPAVFQPVRIAEREYVDGGLVAPVPVRYARQMGATHVIAVDISMPPELGSPDGTLGLLLQTFAIMGRSINQYELREADVVLRPQMIGLSSADMSNRVRAIRAGREVATAQLPQLRERLGLSGR